MKSLRTASAWGASARSTSTPSTSETARVRFVGDELADRFDLRARRGRRQQRAHRLLAARVPSARRAPAIRPSAAAGRGKWGHSLISLSPSSRRWSSTTRPAARHSSRSSAQRARIEGLAARRASEADDLPADEARLPRRDARASRCARRRRDRRCSPAAATRAWRPRRAAPASATSNAAVAAIELGRGGRGDQRVRARVHLHVDAQLVAADDAAGRMHEIDVAGIAFGIERPLHDERPAWCALDQARATRSQARRHCQRNRASCPH